MSSALPHSNRKGMDAALDQVEETLESLRKKVEKKQQQEEKRGRVKDAATNTTPSPPPSVTSSKGSRKARNKSVLIKRSSRYKGKRTKYTSTSGLDNKPSNTHDRCRHCKQRTGGRSEERVTKPSDHKLHGIRERLVWKRGERKDVSDDYESCLCSRNTCGPVYDDSDRCNVKKGFIWTRGRDLNNHRSCLCSRNTCGPVTDDSDTNPKEDFIWKHHRRGEKQGSDDYETRNYKDPDLQNREKGVIWKHGYRGQEREDSEDGDTYSHHDREIYKDPGFQNRQKRVIWNHGYRGQGNDSDGDTCSHHDREIYKAHDTQSKQERVQWKHGRIGQEREDSEDGDSCLHHDRPIHDDVDTQSKQKRVIWKHGRIGQGSEDSEDSCLHHDRPIHDDVDTHSKQQRVRWKHGRNQSGKYSDHGKVEDDPSLQKTKEKVIWRRGRRDERGEESDICEEYSSYPHATQKPPYKPFYSNEYGCKELLCSYGKRGYNRDSDSSSTHSTSKTKQTRPSMNPKRMEEGGKSRRKGMCKEKECNHKLKEEQDVEMRCVCKCKQCIELHKGKKEVKQAAQGNANMKRKEVIGRDGCMCDQGKKKPTPPKPIDVESQGYAQPTHTSRLKTDQSHPQRKEKENIIPYIPCGAKSHSYHVGIIAQQEMSRLLNQPLREHTHLKGQSKEQAGALQTNVMEETVKQAMTNIHHHLNHNNDQ